MGTVATGHPMSASHNPPKSTASSGVPSVSSKKRSREQVTIQLEKELEAQAAENHALGVLRDKYKKMGERVEEAVQSHAKRAKIIEDLVEQMNPDDLKFLPVLYLALAKVFSKAKLLGHLPVAHLAKLRLVSQAGKHLVSHKQFIKRVVREYFGEGCPNPLEGNPTAVPRIAPCTCFGCNRVRTVWDGAQKAVGPMPIDRTKKAVFWLRVLQRAMGIGRSRAPWRLVRRTDILHSQNVPGGFSACCMGQRNGRPTLFVTGRRSSLVAEVDAETGEQVAVLQWNENPPDHPDDMVHVHGVAVDSGAAGNLFPTVYTGGRTDFIFKIRGRVCDEIGPVHGLVDLALDDSPEGSLYALRTKQVRMTYYGTFTGELEKRTKGSCSVENQVSYTGLKTQLLAATGAHDRFRLCVDSGVGGRVYVTDFRKGMVVGYDKKTLAVNFALLFRWTPGHVIQQWQPLAVAVDADPEGYLYVLARVSDYGEYEFQKSTGPLRDPPWYRPLGVTWCAFDKASGELVHAVDVEGIHVSSDSSNCPNCGIVVDRRGASGSVYVVKQDQGAFRSDLAQVFLKPRRGCTSITSPMRFTAYLPRANGAFPTTDPPRDRLHDKIVMCLRRSADPRLPQYWTSIGDGTQFAQSLHREVGLPRMDESQKALYAAVLQETTWVFVAEPGLPTLFILKRAYGGPDRRAVLEYYGYNPSMFQSLGLPTPPKPMVPHISDGDPKPLYENRDGWREKIARGEVHARGVKRVPSVGTKVDALSGAGLWWPATVKTSGMRNVDVVVHDGREKAGDGKVTTWSLYMNNIRRRRYVSASWAWVAAEVRTPQVMVISGAVGDNADKINGNYNHVPDDPSITEEEPSYKCVLYKRQAETTTTWLKFEARANKWLVCTTTSGNPPTKGAETTIWARGEPVPPGTLPHEVPLGKWHVIKRDGTFTPQPFMKVISS